MLCLPSVNKLASTVSIMVIFLISVEAAAQTDRLDVVSEFVASGWMGDGEGEQGPSHVRLEEASTETPHSRPHCVKVHYLPGNIGWAGVYWHNEPDNWCKEPGFDLSKRGFRRITFWARGAQGGEVVEFLAGGVECGAQYKDSFKAQTSPRRLTLTSEWEEYEISLEGHDLSSVIGGFAWVASRSANPQGLTFFIDDIFYVK